MPLNQLKNQHLLWRAGFGPVVENAIQLHHTKPHQLWQLLKKGSSKSPAYIDVATGTVDGLLKGVNDAIRMENLSAEQKKEAQRQQRKQSVEDLNSLNLYWLREMIRSDAQLREKMSLFWHGHFACRVINIFYQQQLLDVIRQNALGNFGDLLRGVSKSAAMLSFLNNQQNKKKHPNENFAREVMELFTMGRGNYTEEDIRESARAYTGWGFNLSGEFVSRQNAHDTGNKTFLGRSGNFDGDDILNIILEQKSTAHFLTRKIYTFFVNDQVNEEHIKRLAERFYQSNYNILQLMEDIFTSEWFYDKEIIGTRIKSPVELMAGIQRMVPLQLARPQIQLVFQRTLGQILFYPPNVAGWPGGKSWIDSSSIIWRMRLPQIITQNDSFSIKSKDDDDVMMGKEGTSKSRTYQVSATIDWDAIAANFSNISREDLLPAISGFLLQSNDRVPGTIINRYADSTSRTAYIRSVIIDTMSTPEYQLC